MLVKKRLVLFFLLGFNLVWLAACGGTPTPTPLPTETAVSQTLPPTETATDEPATAVPATPTTEILPTEPEPTSEALFPTPVVTPTPTLTPTLEMPNYTVTIAEPAPATTLLAGREVTFRGEVQPPTTDPLTLTVTIGSFTAVSAQIIPDASSGSWELTTTLAEAVSGPGLLTVALGDLTQAEQPLPLAFDSSTDGTYISLARPMQGETAVAGHAFLMQGDSNNLLNDSFTIGVLVDDCTNFIAAQKISLASGSWYGFVILPLNVDPGLACAVAYTGEYNENGWREALIPVQLLAADDPQATVLQLGNSGELSFTVGRATSLFGIAINVPERAVDIMLELDLASGGSQLVTSGTAFADQFGLWSIDLELPDDAPSGPALLTISSGADASYQEIRLAVNIAP
jgi:hypothetical protein